MAVKKTFKAGDYSKRSELENAVRNSLGLTPEVKDATITGTKEELARLQLGDRNIFWGISCVVSDEPTQPVKQKDSKSIKRGKVEVGDEAPDRGVRSESGIN